MNGDDDVVQRAAVVIHHHRQGFTTTEIARALHGAGLLAEPDDEIEWTDDKSYVVAPKSDPLIQHALTGAMGEVARRGATSWRLRGEFVDVLAARWVGHDKTAEEVREIAADLVAHLDAEGES